MRRNTSHDSDHHKPSLLGRLARDRSGNTLAIVAAAIAPLLAMVGGGIDMGRSYLAESRLQQACDAGVLAARKKLGSAAPVTLTVPADVGTTGRRFFDANFHDGAYGTENLDFQMNLEADYSISGEATVDVPTTIMRIFGNTNIPLHVNCEARLNYSNTDVMMVLDTTGSMSRRNPGDTEPKIDVLRDVVRSFHAQLEASKAPGVRVRYGFVPYAVNVNVGHLLEDDWVASNWTYQSRQFDHVEGADTGTTTYPDNWNTTEGDWDRTVVRSYAATWHPAANESSNGWWSCDQAEPADTLKEDDKKGATETSPWTGPPSGTMTVEHHTWTGNGTDYWTDFSGSTCTIYADTSTNQVATYDMITIPVATGTSVWRYAPISRSTGNWRSESTGCIEERRTYEIDDWSNVKITYDGPGHMDRALDLNIDLVPDPSDPDTQWKPQYPGIIWARRLESGNDTNNWQVAPEVTSDEYFKPEWWPSAVACPTAARTLAEMTSGEIDSYLNSLSVGGNTYHDIGMIWGGRLISATGIFADANADVGGKPTSRNLIFLTDGETQPREQAYSSYGLEPLDRRRWDPANPQGGLNLTQVIENRFTFACQEVRRHNVTVWVVGFGTQMTDMLKSCAGEGHWFQADDSVQLNEAFSKIARAMGDLRISK